MTIEYQETGTKSPEAILPAENSIESGQSTNSSALDVGATKYFGTGDTARNYFDNAASTESTNNLVSKLSIEENPALKSVKSHLNLPPIAQTLYPLSRGAMEKGVHGDGLMSFHPTGRMLDTVELVSKTNAVKPDQQIEFSPLPDPKKSLLLAEITGNKTETGNEKANKSDTSKETVPKSKTLGLSSEEYFRTELEKLRTEKFGKFLHGRIGKTQEAVEVNGSAAKPVDNRIYYDYSGNQRKADGSLVNDAAPRKPDESDKTENPQDEAKQETRDYWKRYWKDYYDRVKKLTEGKDKGAGVGPDTGKHGQRIHGAAEKLIGQQVWKDHADSRLLQDGRIGSTASISKILQGLGYKHATSPLAAGLAKQLLESGWKPVALDNLKPGDVIYGGKTADWHKGGGNAHMAIVDADGTILHNNSETGTWERAKIEDIYQPGTYGKRIWALRPPADGPEHKITRRRTRGDIPGDGTVYPDNVGEGDASIVNSAARSVGKAMYLGLLSYSQGRLGCAASVSNVLKGAGYGYAHHAGVYGLHKQLLNRGWQKLPASQAQPGDVIIGIRRSNWAAGGGGSHVGIVGEGNTSYHNSSSKRAWIKDSLSRWNTSRYRLGVFVLRPPQRT